jgi:hypothetical protein
MHPKNLEQLGKINELQKLRGQGRGYGLLQLVSKFRSAKATDPRDKIYAFLGFCGNQLLPTYTANVRHVYMDFVRHCMERDRNAILERLDNYLPSDSARRDAETLTSASRYGPQIR